jgi:plastocyanin
MTPAGGSTVAGRDELHNAVISPTLKQPHVTYTFSEPGVYRYVCLLHPFMRGTIDVAAPGASVPGAATVLPAAGRRLGHDWAAAAQRAKAVPAKRATVLMGIGTTRFSVDSFRPAALTVKVGTTVTFVNRSPAELHDVAFGPPGYLRTLLRTTDLIPRSPTSARNQVSPFLRYGTDPPGRLVHDGRNHGNGTLIGPLTDDRAGTCPGCAPGISLPGQTRITFTRPGTYRYVCLLHAPQMHGVIVVRR